jgi:hypothetical protein
MIRIIDNFFDEKIFLNIKNFSKIIPYQPKFFKRSEENKESKEFTSRDTYGLRFKITHEPELIKTYENKIKEVFNFKTIKIHEESGIDKRKLDMFKPHKDYMGKLNLLHMIDGPTDNTNGTVFYSENNEGNYELDIHVGFKENRAILFPSLHMHSPAVSKKKIWRTTSTMFIEDYD